MAKKNKNTSIYGDRIDFPLKSTIVPWEEWTKFEKPIETAPLSKEELVVLEAQQQTKNSNEDKDFFEEDEEEYEEYQQNVVGY